MQTFLPYPDFDESVATLDRARLGKQRVETLQIMNALMLGQGWVHHPATKMWRGYELALLDYQQATVEEWVGRGYKDTCLEKTRDVFFGEVGGRFKSTRLPPWIGDVEFHLSHQSNLIRKNPEYYGPQFPDVPKNLPYIWP